MKLHPKRNILLQQSKITSALVPWILKYYGPMISPLYKSNDFCINVKDRYGFGTTFLITAILQTLANTPLFFV